MSYSNINEDNKQKGFYKNVRDNLSNVREVLLTSDENYESDDKQKLQEALSIFENCEKKANKDLAELEANAEWKRLNMAFYGETNAGKSTLIESLRLYFKDDKKLKEQENFKKAFDKFAETKAILDSIGNELKSLNNVKYDNENKKLEKESELPNITNNIDDI